MTHTPLPRWMALAAICLSHLAGAHAETAQPRTYCRFVPERMDDFAWENDVIAFRAYGPALRDGLENSGIDCWLKRVPTPIIDKWYREETEGKPYHVDHGEGYDPYKVGSSRGCGGLGLWIDGEIVTSDVFTDWKIIQCEPDESVFELNYEWTHGGNVYRENKQITIRIGDRLFKAVSTFTKNGTLAENLPIAIGLVLHGSPDGVSMDLAEGWMAYWETIDGDGLGTGVVIDPNRILGYELIDSPENHANEALLITETDANGQVTYFAGYGWERAGEITTSDDWDAYLAEFSE